MKYALRKSLALVLAFVLAFAASPYSALADGGAEYEAAGGEVAEIVTDNVAVDDRAIAANTTSPSGVTINVPDEALYFAEGVAISDGALLAGVTAEDKDGGNVTVTIADYNGFDITNPQAKTNTSGNPVYDSPYVITYEAEDAESEEVSSDTRRVYITTAASGIIDLSLLNNSMPASGGDPSDPSWTYSEGSAYHAFKILKDVFITGEINLPEGEYITFKPTASTESSASLLWNGAEVTGSTADTLVDFGALTGDASKKYSVAMNRGRIENTMDAGRAVYSSMSFVMRDGAEIVSKSKGLYTTDITSIVDGYIEAVGDVEAEGTNNDDYALSTRSNTFQITDARLFSDNGDALVLDSMGLAYPKISGKVEMSGNFYYRTNDYSSAYLTIAEGASLAVPAGKELNIVNSNYPSYRSKILVGDGGSFIVEGKLAAEDKTQIETKAGGAFNIADGASFVGNGGNVVNAGTISIDENTTFENNGNITNEGTIYIGGSAANARTARIAGYATFNNNGDITNEGLIEVAASGIFNNSSESTVLNNGTINIAEGASFTNSGVVDNNFVGTVTGEVAGTLPINSEEETPVEITDVEIDITAPVAGELRTTPTVDANANYTVSSQGWRSSQGYLLSGQSYEPGVKYTGEITLKPKSGYVFNLDSIEDITVSSGTVASNSTLNDQSLVVYVSFPATDVPPSPELITEIELDFTAPAAGELAGYPTIPSGANYEPYTNNYTDWVQWYNAADNSRLQIGEPFDPGISYYARVCLKPTGEYEFPNSRDEIEITTANGVVDQISAYSTVIRFRVSFDATEGTQTEITEVGIDYFPKAGELPGKIITIGGGYKVGYVDWYPVYANGDWSNYPLQEGQTFEADKTYAADITLYADYSLIFNPDMSEADVALPSGGSVDYIDVYNSKTLYIGVLYHIPAEEPAGNETVITDVQVDINAPVAGGMAGDKATAGSEEYEVTLTEWFDEDEDLLDDGDIFLEQSSYFAHFEMVAKPGYIFDENNAPIISGTNGDVLRIEYSNNGFRIDVYVSYTTGNAPEDFYEITEVELGLDVPVTGGRTEDYEEAAINDMEGYYTYWPDLYYLDEDGEKYYPDFDYDIEPSTVYYLEVELLPKPYRTFASFELDPANIKVSNGTVVEGSIELIEDYEYEWYDYYGECLSFTVEFPPTAATEPTDPGTPEYITEVELDITAPVAGAVSEYPSVAEDADYEVSSDFSRWHIDDGDGEYTWGVDEIIAVGADTFEPNAVYFAAVELNGKSGALFSTDIGIDDITLHGGGEIIRLGTGEEPSYWFQILVKYDPTGETTDPTDPTDPEDPLYTIAVTNGFASAEEDIEGAPVLITADEPQEGKAFSHWTITPADVEFMRGDVNTPSISIKMPAANVTAVANYKDLPKDQFSITVDNDGNGIGTAIDSSGAAVSSVKEGTRITLKAEPSDGYRIKDWQVISGGVTVSNNSFTMPAANVTVKAIFEKISENYTVTINGSYSSSSGAGSYKPGTLVTVRAGSRSNYDFDGWSVTGATLANRNNSTTTFTMPFNNVTVKANWEYDNGNSSRNRGDDDDDHDRGRNNNNRPSSGSNTGTGKPSPPSLSKENAGYDPGRGGDISIPLNIGNATFGSLQNGSYTLKEGQDYTRSGNVFTLSEDYLSELEEGGHTLTFRMNGGSDLSFDLAVGEGEGQDEGRAVETTEAPAETPEPSEAPVPAATPAPAATPVPVAQTPTASPFQDVSVNDPYFREVMFVYSNGLMNGTGTDAMLFSPNAELSRGMIVTLLYRLYGSPDVTGIVNPFSDAAEGDWYTGAIKWAVSNGIVNGLGNGTYGVNNGISRQDLIVILARFADFAGVTLPVTQSYMPHTDDANVGEYARTAIARFSAAGIIASSPDVELLPTGTATRADVAVILTRFLESIQQQ